MFYNLTCNEHLAHYYLVPNDRDFYLKPSCHEDNATCKCHARNTHRHDSYVWYRKVKDKKKKKYKQEDLEQVYAYLIAQPLALHFFSETFFRNLGPTSSCMQECTCLKSVNARKRNTLIASAENRRKY